jgi:hypothetical protein
MDIVEYAEKIIGSELPDWQKAALRDLYDLRKRDPKKFYIIMRPYNGTNAFYTYLKENNIPTCKELTQYGTTSKSC